jgi:hypothetical protein
LDQRYQLKINVVLAILWVNINEIVKHAFSEHHDICGLSDFNFSVSCH